MLYLHKQLEMNNLYKVILQLLLLATLVGVSGQTKFGLIQNNSVSSGDISTVTSRLGLNIESHINVRYSFLVTTGFQYSLGWAPDNYGYDLSYEDEYTQVGVGYGFLGLGLQMMFGQKMGVNLKYVNLFKGYEIMNVKEYSFESYPPTSSTSKDLTTGYLPKYNGSVNMQFFYGRKFKVLLGLGIDNLVKFNIKGLDPEGTNDEHNIGRKYVYQGEGISINLGFSLDIYSVKVFKEK